MSSYRVNHRRVASLPPTPELSRDNRHQMHNRGDSEDDDSESSIDIMMNDMSNGAMDGSSVFSEQYTATPINNGRTAKDIFVIDVSKSSFAALCVLHSSLCPCTHLSHFPLHPQWSNSFVVIAFIGTWRDPQWLDSRLSSIEEMPLNMPGTFRGHYSTISTALYTDSLCIKAETTSQAMSFKACMSIYWW